MTFTYSLSPLDNIARVRQMTGETIQAESSISDEEITAWLTDKNGNVAIASIGILRQLAAMYTKKANVTSGNEKLEMRGIAADYLAMARELDDIYGKRGKVRNKAVNRVRDSDKYRPPLGMNTRINPWLER